MQTKRAKTFIATGADLKRAWRLFDGENKVLGQLASEIALILQGKDKPTYTPNLDGGDYVVVINASKIVLTRGKENKKTYSRHSNFPGGYREETFAKLQARQPEAILRRAVKGMLPDNRLRDKRLARLKVFALKEHDYQNYLAPAAAVKTKLKK